MSESGAEKDKQQTATLAQFYTAEYSVVMTRISAWANLQYAAMPILIAALALLVNMDQISEHARWWIAVFVVLAVYAAFQSTMIDAMHNVLFVERFLRPRARTLVGTDDFWIYERVRAKNFPPNPAWSPLIPSLLSFGAISFVAVYIWFKYGFGWIDWIVLGGALVLGGLIIYLTWLGKRLKKQVLKECKKSNIPIAPLYDKDE
jgi:hypothetical protein